MYSTYSSNNERGFLKSNGPHQLRSTGTSCTGVRYPQVVETAKPVVIGEVKIYGTETPKADVIKKNDVTEDKQIHPA